MSAELISVGSAMFSLGILHALDPAHGKVFLGGYFGKVLKNPRDLVIVSLLVSVIQTLFLLAVGVTIAFFSLQLVGQAQLERFSDVLSGASLILLGGVMLWHQQQHMAQNVDCCNASHHHKKEDKDSLKKVIPMAILWGLIPCPIAFTALLTGFSLGDIALTIGSLIVFTLGVTCIIVSSGLCFLYGSHFVAHRLQFLSKYVPIIGFGFAVLTLIVGILITIGAYLNIHLLPF